MNESIVQLSLVTHADAYTPICARRTKSLGYCSLAASGILFSELCYICLWSPGGDSYSVKAQGI